MKAHAVKAKTASARHRFVKLPVAAAAAILVTVLATGPTAAASWTTPVPLSPLAAWSCGQSLALRSTNGTEYLHAAYNHTGSTNSVVYRRSADHGATFPTSAVLAGDTVRKGCAAVAASSSLLVVAWTQITSDFRTASIHLRVSTTNGLTFEPKRRIPMPRSGRMGSVALVGSRILVAWTDDWCCNTPTITWSRVGVSDDRGLHWSVRTLDAQPSWSGSEATKVAASGSRVFAAWMRPDTRTLVGRFSVDGGTTWQPPQVLATGPTTYRYPWWAIAARPDRAVIAWQGERRNPDETGPRLHLRIFAGGAWRAPVTVTAARADSEHYLRTEKPSVVLVGSSRVGVAFTACQEVAGEQGPTCDVAEIGPYPEDVLWAESTNNGATWSGPSIASPAGQVVVDHGGWARPSAAWGTLRAMVIQRLDSERPWPSRVFVIRGPS